MNKVLLLLFLLSGLAQAKSSLTKRAMTIVTRHIAHTYLPTEYTKEEMQRFYEEGKVVKLYDLVIYELLVEAGLPAKSVDYTEAILQADGWVTVDVESIVYAYPADQPPGVYPDDQLPNEEGVSMGFFKWLDKKMRKFFVGEVYEDRPEVQIWQELEQIAKNETLTKDQRNRAVALKLRELNRLNWR